VNFKALDSCSLKSHSTLEQLCLALPSQELSNELLPFKHIEPPTSNIHCFAKAQSSYQLLYDKLHVTQELQLCDNNQCVVQDDLELRDDNGNVLKPNEGH
jgi:hypothetical protein